MNSHPLPLNFYSRDTIIVAEELIGHHLVRKINGRVYTGRILETEAYLGQKDPACHTYGGRRTSRTESMYGRPGTAYVYFIYGMHFCFNVVTGNGEAVLIRALKAGHGFTDGEKNTKTLSGPAKLCKALRIDKSFDRHDLLDSDSALYIAAGEKATPPELLVGSRIGVESYGDAAHFPLRFGDSRLKEFLSPPQWI